MGGRIVEKNKFIFYRKNRVMKAITEMMITMMMARTSDNDDLIMTTMR
jgi:hypothetical protein